jgi:4-hydroxy-2-oxoglutarate aldolase
MSKQTLTSRDLTGIYAPVVTTFAGDGELDAEAFARNVAAHLAAGMTGIVVTGSTGEAALLDETERGRLIDAARRAIPGDRQLIVGAGAESTRTTIRHATSAADRGADAVLVVAPHYYGNAMTDAALLAHYRAVADASPVPVLLYTIPKYMHFALSAGLVAELAKHDNVIGMKDSSGKIDLLNGYLAAQSDSFTVLTGNGGTFLKALEAGARGGILAVGLFAPALAFEVYQSFGRGEGAAAAQAQEPLTRLSNRIVGELGIGAIKTSLEAIGLDGGAVRPPLMPVGSAEAREVAQLLRATELVPSAG